MNERITTYLDEVYGNGSKNAQNLAQLVAAFEQKYETKVGDILIGRTGDEFDAMALFCEGYVAVISIQPEQSKYSGFVPYNSIERVEFDDNDGMVDGLGYYRLKVKGHHHWAMDAIRAHILPRFK